MYFYLLLHVLGPLNQLNRFFQKKEPVNSEAEDEIHETFRVIANFIIERGYVMETPVSKINLLDRTKWLHFGNFDLGESIGKEIINRHDDGIEEFMENAFKFILAILLEFQNRFDNFNDDILAGLKCLNPKNALDKKFHENNVESFHIFTKTFKFIIPTDEIMDSIYDQ